MDRMRDHERILLQFLCLHLPVQKKKKKMAAGVSCLSHTDVVYVVKITPSTPQFSS